MGTPATHGFDIPAGSWRHLAILERLGLAARRRYRLGRARRMEFPGDCIGILVITAAKIVTLSLRAWAERCLGLRPIIIPVTTVAASRMSQRARREHHKSTKAYDLFW